MKNGPNTIGRLHKQSIINRLTELGACPKRPHEQKVKDLEKIVIDIERRMKHERV